MKKDTSARKRKPAAAAPNKREEPRKKTDKALPRKKSRKALRIVLIVLGVLVVLAGAALLIIRQIIKTHTDRVQTALAGTQADLFGLFADDETLLRLWNNGVALYTSDGLSFSIDAGLRAEPHPFFTAEDPSWPLTVEGERDTQQRCCAGTLQLGAAPDNTLDFSLDAAQLQLRLSPLEPYGASLDALEAQGIILPEILRFSDDAAVTVAVQKRAGAAQPQEDLFSALFVGASGMPAAQVRLETDGGGLDCDHYQVHWDPAQADMVLETLAMDGLGSRTLLLDDTLRPDTQALTLLWAAVRDGALDENGLLCAVSARLLLDFEPTAELYLADGRLRGADLTRKDNGATVTVRLEGDGNVFSHVVIHDEGNGGTLEFRHATGSLLSLTLTGLGDSQTLLRYEQPDGSFCIRLGQAADRWLEGTLLPTEDGLTLEYGAGEMFLGPISFSVELPKVEFLWMSASYDPLAFTLQPQRLTLRPQQQAPQMLSESCSDLLSLSLFDAAKIAERLYQVFNGSEPVEQGAALAGSYRLAYVTRSGFQLDPSTLGFQMQSIALYSDGSASGVNLTLPGMNSWTADETSLTLRNSLGGSLTLTRVGDTLQYTEELTGITFVFEKE